VFDQLTDYISGSNWSYLWIAMLAAFDVIVPLLPSETSVILAGVLASSGKLELAPVIAVAACGAIIGDNLAYWIGRGPGERLLARIPGVGTNTEMRAWAERQLQERGAYLIVIGRFIPGGRTLLTVTAGALGYPWRRFIIWDIIAGVIWASYAAGLGYVGGRAFEEQPWKGFAAAFAVALAVTGIVEAVRWVRRRRAAAAATDGEA
jgi:membrane-associated protein